jgi:hypothetical protein
MSIKPERKGQLEIPMQRIEYNIKMDLMTGCEGVSGSIWLRAMNIL